MTAHDGFTRLLDTWLAEEGMPTTPDYLDRVLDRTSTTRQRPAWLSPGRWLPMDTTALDPRAYSVPPALRYGLLAVLLIILAAAAVALYAGSQQRRLPPPFGPAANGQIYFDADGAIVVTESDGTGRHTIDVGVPAAGPSLSLDGTKFMFVAVNPSEVAGDRVYIANADGSNPHLISGDLPLDIDPGFSPSWSPDGSRIVFGAYSQGSNQLFVAETDGSGVRPLGDPNAFGTDRTWNASYGRQNPKWSTTGDWIAFIALPPSGDPLLAVIRPDGTDEHVLPASAGAGNGLRGTQLWSPDDTNRLLYGIGFTDEGLGDAIAVMDVDTGVETILSDQPGITEHRGAWSPDGTRIAYHSGDDIAVINADGTGRSVLPDRLSQGSIAWSPDGAWLFGKSASDDELMAIDAAGKQPPIVIPVDGAESGVSSWQRLAP
jgi:Tol biopolymer transport system component